MMPDGSMMNPDPKFIHPARRRASPPSDTCLITATSTTVGKICASRLGPPERPDITQLRLRRLRRHRSDNKRRQNGRQPHGSGRQEIPHRCIV
jgi:hypothetical protein